MKNFVKYLMIIMILYSCKKTSNNYEGVIVDFNLIFLITDETFKDRLNPESSVFFGEEYVQGIKLYSIVNGQKREIIDYNQQFIKPPVRWFENENHSGYIDQGSHGYYYIPFYLVVKFFHEEDGNIVTHLYIQYPDESEDVIKVREYKNKSKTVHTYDKIWINGELAFEWGSGFEDRYYNPKYFPWQQGGILNLVIIK